MAFSFPVEPPGSWNLAGSPWADDPLRHRDECFPCGFARGEDERGMHTTFTDARPLRPRRLNFQRYFTIASTAEQKRNFPLDPWNTDRTYSDHNPKRERPGEHTVKASNDASSEKRSRHSQKDATG